MNSNQIIDEIIYDYVKNRILKDISTTHGKLAPLHFKAIKNEVEQIKKSLQDNLPQILELITTSDTNS